MAPTKTLTKSPVNAPADGTADGTADGGTGATAAKRARKRRAGPNRAHERSLAELGFEVVAGLDEVGRGAWAGPVSVGVVVFPPDAKPPRGVRDSKELTEERREELFPLIVSWCADWSVGHADSIECDRLGMTAALRLAARRALGGLSLAPHAVLMDGNFDYVSAPAAPADPTDPADPADPAGAADPADPAHPSLGEATAPHVRTVVRGDAACVSIAAASIVAKVTRDRQMRALSPSFPAFDFHRNKGYPSPVHRRALDGNGLTSIHRRSWSFVGEMAFR